MRKNSSSLKNNKPPTIWYRNRDPYKKEQGQDDRKENKILEEKYMKNQE